MENDVTYFMGHLWYLESEGQIVVGVSEEGIDQITDIQGVNLPEEGEVVIADEVCGEIETNEGPLNIYAPVDGKVVEINEAVKENPQLIFEDSMGDGWLIKIDPNSDEDDDDEYSEEDLEAELDELLEED
jgi:glycine cleavage system H protein